MQMDIDNLTVIELGNQNEDGATSVLACTCAANAGPSTASSVGRTAEPIVGCPAFLVFARPTGAVRSAALTAPATTAGADPAAKPAPQAFAARVAGGSLIPLYLALIQKLIYFLFLIL
jgi:hypothetical protein